LPDAYSNALGVCYVSLYEGFGLPILEALSCGTPVLCGDNSSQTEVGGEVALYADATDVQSISRGMRELYELGNNPETRYRAMKQSWSFSWQRVAYETLQTYLKSVE
jgi:glycosyltransferase involved in cell wall biosynthesis